MKITKRQLKRIIKEAGREEQLGQAGLESYQIEGLEDLKLEVEHCLSIGISADLIRKTVLEKVG